MKPKAQILIVLSRFPYPLEKGDKLRAYHQIRTLAESYEIHLVTMSDKDISSQHKKQLEKYCKTVEIHRINFLSKTLGLLRAFINGLPFQTGYFYRSSARKSIKLLIESKDIKHIYCQLIRTAELTKDIHHITKTLDYMDALSAGIERRIDLQPFYKKWLFKSEANRLRKYERSVFDYFENTTIISEQDRNLISHPDREKISLIPNGVDPSFFEDKSSKNEYDFVFVGNMSYPPNIEAAHYIAQRILPNIEGSTLLLAGATPHQSLLKLEKQNKNVSLTGWVDDIRDAYLNGKIFLAPMMIGTGMQNKLLEAMALGVPCITTSLANNAINAKHNESIIVANDEAEIVSACEELLSDDKKRKDIAENARSFIHTNYNWDKSTQLLKDLINKSIKE